MDKCPSCRHPLVKEGEQPNVIRSTMSMLGSCVNPDCDNHLSTFGFSERPMTQAELNRYAALRERLGIS